MNFATKLVAINNFQDSYNHICITLTYPEEIILFTC